MPVQRMPPALFLLPALTSLTLNDVGLGRLPPLPAQPAHLQGLYPLPRELSQLAPSLRELALMQHCCAPDELAVLSQVGLGLAHSHCCNVQLSGEAC